MKHSIFGSEYPSLQLDDLYFTAFKKEEEELYIKYQKLMKAKYGIWATNQNKFVSSEEELNSFDSKVYLEY